MSKNNANLFLVFSVSHFIFVVFIVCARIDSHMYYNNGFSMQFLNCVSNNAIVSFVSLVSILSGKFFWSVKFEYTKKRHTRKNAEKNRVQLFFLGMKFLYGVSF